MKVYWIRVKPFRHNHIASYYVFAPTAEHAIGHINLMQPVYRAWKYTIDDFIISELTEYQSILIEDKDITLHVV